MKNTVWQQMGRSVSLCVLVISLSVSLSACAALWSRETGNDGQAKFWAKFWQTPRAGSGYPEMADPAISTKRASFGVAFQGGGNRAAPAALGQLRALHDLGWIDDVRYISAISGGSWTAIPYTFLKRCPVTPGIYCDEDQFLGTSQSASEVARRLPRLSKDDAPAEFFKGSMLRAISDGAISGKVIGAWLRGRFDESFADALGKIYLKPFGLTQSSAHVPDSIFTWRKSDRDRILSTNPRFSKTQIHYVERDRPYLIAGGTVLTKRMQIYPNDKFRMEMTPLYTGIPRKIKYRTKTGANIQLGGGFVESFGYDYVTDHVDRSTNPARLRLRDPKYGNRTNGSRLNFSLSNMAAVTGAAPVENAVSFPGLRFLAANFGFPEHYAPVDQETLKQHMASANKGETYERERAHGDGGHEDNLGLAPLLARQVDNILVFANSFVPLSAPMIAKCKDAINQAPLTVPKPDALSEDMALCIKMIGDDIPSFFVETDKQIHNVGWRLLDSETPEGRAPLGAYYDLLTVAEDLKNNDNLSCRRYQYAPRGAASKRAITSSAYTPTICILFLGLDQDWVNEIRETTEREAMAKPDIHSIRKTLELGVDWTTVVKKRRGFGSNGFPHIGTFWDTPGYLIKTARPRLYALSNFTSWKLNKHSNEISGAFGLNGLILSKR